MSYELIFNAESIANHANELEALAQKVSARKLTVSMSKSKGYCAEELLAYVNELNAITQSFAQLTRITGERLLKSAELINSSDKDISTMNRTIGE